MYESQKYIWVNNKEIGEKRKRREEKLNNSLYQQIVDIIKIVLKILFNNLFHHLKMFE